MLVSKGRDKYPRVIARATVRDKLILTALKEVLHETLPSEVPRKLPNQVVRDLLASLQSNAGCRIVRADIKAFYDSIPHKKIMAMLKARLGDGLVNKLVHSAIVNPIVPVGYRRANRASYVTARGVPQGLPISNFLAHLFLSKFDQKVDASISGYHRYVDDMIVLVSPGTEGTVRKSFEKRLAGLGLRLSKEKTRVFDFDETFDFLGYEITAGRAKPRVSSVERFIRSVAGLFSQLRSRRLPGRRVALTDWSDEELAKVFVEELNEKITGAVSQHKQYGWVFYFNESTDLSVFNRIDRIVSNMADSARLLSESNRKAIKSLSRAFYESKYKKLGGYIVNYDAIENTEDKRRFLLRLRYLRQDEAESANPDRIDSLYKEVVAQRLSRLDQDIGLIS